MLVSNKHFTPVIGLDIHFVILFGFPIPLPHPYIGFVLDPMDYIPFIGATTKINHVPRGKSDTSGILIIIFHIPMGGPFLMYPLIGHDSMNFFGSKRVKVEGNMMSPSGHMLMTCNDIGIPLSLQPGKKLKPLPSMYLPTSFSIPLSFGRPVMVGGPYVPDWAGALLNMLMSFGFGALLKGLGKLGKKALTKFNHALKGKLGSNKLSKFLCKKGFEPVDLVQGIVIYDATDFELTGPIPLIWERSWNSDSPFNGALGHGAHLSYDMRVQEFATAAATVVLMGDGRSAVFEPLPYVGNADHNRHEKLTLTRKDIDEYQLFDQRKRLSYHFHKLQPQDEQYRLYAIRNEAGFMISFHYNSKGCLARVIDSAGRQLHVDNDPEGRITRVTARHRDKTQVLVQYAYNNAGDLVEITDALQQSTRVQYQDHRMVSRTDRNGQTFYWEYDDKGRCTHTWGDGGILEGYIEYQPAAGYNRVTNSLGATTTYYYTPDFAVTQVKDPLNFSTYTEYTDHFEIYREIDEEGNLTGYTYDERGNRTRIEQPDGSAYTFAYDAEDRLILSGSPLGNTRAFIYYKQGPNQGLLHTITEADGSITIFRYNAQHLLHIIEDEQERRSLLAYDEDHNLISLTLADSGQTSWKYDAWGRCTATTSPLEHAQHFRYDPLGRVTEVLLPDGNQVQLQYDAYEEVTRVSDKHHQVDFVYTPLGSLKMRQENGVKIHYLYNKEEQLTGLVNQHGETYRLARNERGDIIQETGFDGLIRQYERDGAGQIIKVQRPGRRWTAYEHDYNGRLTRAEHSDGSWETYSYNRNGELMEAVNEHSTIKYERDIMGRVTTEWQNGHTVTSAYDPKGRRKSVQSSLGAHILLQRNAIGDITGIQAQAQGIADPWAAEIQRNFLGLEIERTLPGGVKSRWNYGKAGLPESHMISSYGQLTRSRYYHWDANQRLKQILDGIHGGTVKFGHDELSNLAWAQYEDGQYDYRLPDKAGNLYKTQQRQDRRYGPGGKLLESAEATYHYDAEGNLVKKITAAYAVWEYEWSMNGMLKKVQDPDGKTVAFRYDPLGRRIEKEYRGQLTRFVWDGKTPLHEWRYPATERPVISIDELGALRQDRPEPVPPETLITWVFDNKTFVPAAKLQQGNVYSIITDHLGTPCEAYNASGLKVWSCELDIYGKVRKFAGDKQFVPFRYQGQYEDEETGLYYNRFRYYSPDEGIYISQDPLGLKSGCLNFHQYVSDPNTWTDAVGLHQALAWLDDKPLVNELDYPDYVDDNPHIFHSDRVKPPPGLNTA